MGSAMSIETFTYVCCCKVFTLKGLDMSLLYPVTPQNCVCIFWMLIFLSGSTTRQWFIASLNI